MTLLGFSFYDFKIDVWVTAEIHMVAFAKAVGGRFDGGRFDGGGFDVDDMGAQILVIVLVADARHVRWLIDSYCEQYVGASAMGNVSKDVSTTAAAKD